MLAYALSFFYAIELVFRDARIQPRTSILYRDEKRPLVKAIPKIALFYADDIDRLDSSFFPSFNC